MSDTPRTDDANARLLKHLPWPYQAEKFVEFARQLERELSDMTAYRDSESRWATKYKAERDEAQSLVKPLSRAADQEEADKEYNALLVARYRQERDKARRCLSEAITFADTCVYTYPDELSPRTAKRNKARREMLDRWRMAAGLANTKLNGANGGLPE